jgi:diadenosine tetraphosphate (Ap4A) HIT family hydrolase
MKDCHFCRKEYQESDRTVVENELWFGNFDIHPVTQGHMKVIPKRHVNSIIELTDAEVIAMRDILAEANKLIESKYEPDGYNTGINQGKAAGQTKFHLHIHYIPRYNGDVVDPTGGVRNVIPDKGNYLKTID